MVIAYTSKYIRKHILISNRVYETTLKTKITIYTNTAHAPKDSMQKLDCRSAL